MIPKQLDMIQTGCGFKIPVNEEAEPRCKYCWAKGGSVCGRCICDDIAIAELSGQTFSPQYPGNLKHAIETYQRSGDRVPCEGILDSSNEQSKLPCMVDPDEAAPRCWHRGKRGGAVFGFCIYDEIANAELNGQEFNIEGFTLECITNISQAALSSGSNEV